MAGAEESSEGMTRKRAGEGWDNDGKVWRGTGQEDV